jgi:BirA family biotin operon repressor/biotin-[acetyl-CoA-carboxylase] ligase
MSDDRARAEGVAQWPPGWHVEWVAETGSTNADLLAAGAAGAPDRTVLAAGHQVAGRGRLDRRWEAPPGGNLLVSLLLRDVPTFVHEVTQRVALAAVAACRLEAQASVALKWPNDIVLDGAKLAGVLSQLGTSPQGDFVVVGIGINIAWAPADAARLGDAVTPRKLLRTLLSSYDALPLTVGPLYREHLATIGQNVRVDLPGNRRIVGLAVDIEPDGRLVVIDASAVTHRIDTGDVVHLRPAV